MVSGDSAEEVPVSGLWHMGGDQNRPGQCPLPWPKCPGKNVRHESLQKVTGRDVRETQELIMYR